MSEANGMVELTLDQKKIVVERWNDNNQNPPSISELVLLLFNVREDGFGKYGLSIRKFITESKLKTKTKAQVERRINAPSELTEVQKKWIEKNYSIIKPLEMARYLFDEPKLTPISIEFKLVSDFIKTLPEYVKALEKEESSDGLGIYRPPKTLLASARRVNSFIFNAIDTDDIEKNSKLTNCLTQFIRFCHMPRFVLTYNQYNGKDEKELFESSYVRYVWDKPDLTEEELDIYVNLCSSLVALTNMKKEMDFLTKLREDQVDDSEGKKISMSIVQSLADLRKEINDTEKRVRDTAESLQGKRNERIDTKTKENASLVNLIDFWRNYENRRQMIRLAEIRKQRNRDEVTRIEDMSDLVMEVYGIGKDEAILASI